MEMARSSLLRTASPTLCMSKPPFGKERLRRHANLSALLLTQAARCSAEFCRAPDSLYPACETDTTSHPAPFFLPCLPPRISRCN